MRLMTSDRLFTFFFLALSMANCNTKLQHNLGAHTRHIHNIVSQSDNKLTLYNETCTSDRASKLNNKKVMNAGERISFTENYYYSGDDSSFVVALMTHSIQLVRRKERV